MEYRALVTHQTGPVTCNVCECDFMFVGDDTILCPECWFTVFDPYYEYTPRYRVYIRR